MTEGETFMSLIFILSKNPISLYKYPPLFQDNIVLIVVCFRKYTNLDHITQFYS